MKVTALKCKHTGALFDMSKRAEYIEHIFELRADRKEKRAMARSRKEFAGWLAAERENITDFDQIVPWILENQRIIITQYNARGGSSGWGYEGLVSEKTFFTIIRLDARYNNSVSNTHSCPKSGVQNWGSKKDLPRGYPGWHGSIVGSVRSNSEKVESISMSEFFKLIDIHTGSGSGGGNGYNPESTFQYSVSVFLDDWPKLAEGIAFKKLQNQSYQP